MRCLKYTIASVVKGFRVFGMLEIPLMCTPGVAFYSLAGDCVLVPGWASWILTYSYNSAFKKGGGGESSSLFGFVCLF